AADLRLGPRGRAEPASSAVRAVAQGHGDGLVLGAPVDLQLELLTRLLRRNRLAQLVERRDRLAVDRDDDVAAEVVALAVGASLRGPGLEAGLRRAAVLLDALHEQARLRGEMEEPG